MQLPAEQQLSVNLAIYVVDYAIPVSGWVTFGRWESCSRPRSQCVVREPPMPKKRGNVPKSENIPPLNARVTFRIL